MDACPDAETIAAFAHRTLAVDALARVEQHIAECEPCRVLVSAVVKSVYPATVLSVEMGGSAPQVAPRLSIGSRFGRYEIRRTLGVGGMGEVLLAYDTMLQRFVALKIVRRDRSSPQAVTRLFSEARSAAALKHPNAVMLLDVGEIEGVPFLAMEYVEGDTLRAHLGASGAASEKLAWLAQLASVLAAAHEAGIIHRDVKPDNVIVAKSDGQARVLDFGIAKRIVAIDPSLPTSDVPLSVRTAEGHVVGTSAYMAPEQRAGGAPSPMWDQYAWGVTAYELLSGMRPSTHDVALLHTFRPDVPTDVSLAIACAMAREPRSRHPGMNAIVRILAAKDGETVAPLHVTGERKSTQRRAPYIVALMAFAVGAAVVALRVRHTTTTDAGALAAITSAATVDEAGPSASVIMAQTSASASSSAVVATPEARASSRPPSARAGTMGCLCTGNAAPHFTLCKTLGPSKCECRTAEGNPLCTQPLKESNDVCITGGFGNTSTAVDHDPCDGYERHYVNGQLETTHASGTLTDCQVCAPNATEVYLGAEGTPCDGYLHDRSRAPGSVSCDNLRTRCFIGEAEACTDVGVRHK